MQGIKLRRGLVALARWLTLAVCLVVAAYVLVRPFTPIWLDVAVIFLALAVIVAAFVVRKPSSAKEQKTSETK